MPGLKSFPTNGAPNCHGNIKGKRSSTEEDQGSSREVDQQLYSLICGANVLISFSFVVIFSMSQEVLFYLFIHFIFDPALSRAVAPLRAAYNKTITMKK